MIYTDRPLNVDETRENELLRMLATSWEAPEDVLQELMEEVDTWLDSRVVCIVCHASLVLYMAISVVHHSGESSGVVDKAS